MSASAPESPWRSSPRFQGPRKGHMPTPTHHLRNRMFAVAALLVGEMKNYA